MVSAKDEKRKLRENLMEYVKCEEADRIANAVEFSSEPTCSEKTEWVKQIAEELENNFDENTIKKIRTCCYCDEDGLLEENKNTLKKLYEDSKDIYDFVEKVNRNDAGWYIEDDYLYTKYLDCSCHMLEGIDKLESKTWCYCTIGFNKYIFSNVFGCSFDEIEIELLKTIKTGDDFCLMKIRLPDAVKNRIDN